MLKKPEIARRLVHISIELKEYDLKFMPKSSVKAQAMVDFIFEFSTSPKVIKNEHTPELCNMEVSKSQVWQVFVDGAHNFKRAGMRVILLNHEASYFEYSIRMDFQVTNNITENETAIFGVMTSKTLEAHNLIQYNDSWLVVNQYLDIFKVKDQKMRKYIERMEK